MADNADQVQLGSGVLHVNNIHVGYLSGEVLLTYQRTGMQLPVSGTDPVSVCKCTLRATVAQFDVDHLRFALGLTGSVAASVGALSYNPGSFSIDAGQSWEGVGIGRESVPDTVALRFEHTKSGDTKRICLMLYQAVSSVNLRLPFGSDRVTMHNLEFIGIPDESRSAGDQIGVIIEEV